MLWHLGLRSLWLGLTLWWLRLAPGKLSQRRSSPSHRDLLVPEVPQDTHGGSRYKPVDGLGTGSGQKSRSPGFQTISKIWIGMKSVPYSILYTDLRISATSWWGPTVRLTKPLKTEI